MKSIIFLCLLLSAGQEDTTKTKNVPAPEAQKKEASIEAKEEVAKPDASDGEKPGKESPPLSAYDRQVKEQNSEQVIREDSFTKYIVRTIFSLILIVGLMYFLAKLVLPRYLQGFRPNSKAKYVKVLERTPLDAKHSLYVLEMADGTQILVGTGEKGVQFLTRIDMDSSVGDVTKDFSSLVESKNKQNEVQEEAV